MKWFTRCCGTVCCQSNQEHRVEPLLLRSVLGSHPKDAAVKFRCLAGTRTHTQGDQKHQSLSQLFLSALQRHATNAEYGWRSKSWRLGSKYSPPCMASFLLTPPLRCFFMCLWDFPDCSPGASCSKLLRYVRSGAHGSSCLPSMPSFRFFSR